MRLWPFGKKKQQKPQAPQVALLMHSGTGKIADVDYSEDPERCKYLVDQGILIKLKHKPDPNCSRCYGRGFIGWNTKTKRVILCRCIKE